MQLSLAKHISYVLMLMLSFYRIQVGMNLILVFSQRRLILLHQVSFPQYPSLRPCAHESGSIRLRFQTGMDRPTMHTGSNLSAPVLLHYPYQ